MQATVAVGLGVPDVVLLLHQLYVILFQKGFGEHVDIGGIGADDPHSRYIEDILLYAFGAHGEASPVQLIKEAFRGLESGFYGFNGVTVVFEGKLLVKDLELGLHLHHGALIVCHQFSIWKGVLPHPILDSGLGHNRKKHFLEIYHI